MVSTRRPPLKLARLVRDPVLSRLFNQWLPWLVLAIALCATGLLWQGAQHQLERERQAEFNNSVQEAVRDIELRMETYKLLLHGLQGLFASSRDVSRYEFHTYVATLDLQTRYPGIQGLGYSIIVPQGRVNAHVAAVRASGFSHYDIRPDASKRQFITSIIYIEPFSERNQRAFGYDMYSDPVRRAAMERAQALNKAALSGKIVLQQESNENPQPGFVMFLPVHAPHDPLDRSPVINGWVHAHFRADDLMSALANAHKMKIDFAIYDGEQVTEQSRLSGTGFRATKRDFDKDQLVTTRQLTIAGHLWTLDARSLSGLDAGLDQSQPRIILIAGIGSSFLLTILMQMLIHGRTHALRLAKDMNSELIESEYRWKYALEGAGEGVWDWDIKTGYMFKSRRLKDLLGYAEEEYANTFASWKQNLHPDDLRPSMDALDAYLEGKSPEFSVEGRLRCKDGSWKWIFMRGMVVSRDEDGKPLRMIGTHADITERHQKNESLLRSAAVLNTVTEAVLVTDANNRIISVNPSFTKISGYSSEDVIGKDTSMLFSNPSNSELSDDILQSLAVSGSWQGEIAHRRKNGEHYVVWMSVNSVRNEKGHISNYVSVFSDISERKAAELRMQYLAHFDPLTDLPNRALFNDRLRQAMAVNRRNKTRLALLFIDLDKFKPINDTLGHSVGDLLLREVAYRLLDCIRESDTAGRIGGDEFVVLLSGIETEHDASLVASKILEAIQQPFQFEEHSVHISASIGIAVYPENGQTEEEILTNADNAMYHAKHGGGASIASFNQLLPKST